MAKEVHDLIVLGSGPGGYIAAIRAAQLGRKVTIVERESLGGVCLNWGCIPSKALLRSAQLFHDIHRAQDFGFTVGEIKLDFPRVINRSREVASKLSAGVQFLMKKNKITIVSGHGSLVGNNTLRVVNANGVETFLTYKDIILATGARARSLPGVSVDGETIHTYRTILEYKRLPKKTLIVGAGAIGIEFAYFHSTFGTEVTVVETLPQILPLEDSEVAQSLEKILTRNGIKFLTSSSVSNIASKDGHVSAVITNKAGDKQEEWHGDCLLLAVGVIPNTAEIGIEEAGIKLDRGFVVVDKFLQSSLPNHFAIGDIIRSPQLAHVASHEGIVAAEVASGKATHGVQYDNIPSCTYCQPQVASVGFTEQALKEKGIKYRVGKIPFNAIGKATAIGEVDGFTKVLIDEDHGEVLGVHILHSEATELISEAAIIRSHEGIAASVIDTVHPHPTLSESLAESMALALGRPLNF